jgi:protein gp37
MGLNKSKGNMYEFITHTWNPLGGECPHKCTYCSTNKLKERYPVIKEKYSGIPRLDEKQLKSFGKEPKYIFVCAQNDLFADDVCDLDILSILNHCKVSKKHRYLFQTKNPERIWDFKDYMPENYSLCTTIESNRDYPEIMANSPTVLKRSAAFSYLYADKYITIEPIMDFDLEILTDRIINMYNIKQINIGADSGNNNLPEPSKEKILQLIEELEKFTKVVLKKNLDRLIK